MGYTIILEHIKKDWEQFKDDLQKNVGNLVVPEASKDVLRFSFLHAYNIGVDRCNKFGACIGKCDAPITAIWEVLKI